MHEDLLQFIWASGLFNASGLTTTSGASLEIVSRGTLNTVAGPDFLEAKIKIGGTLWVGSVEVHTRSSYWHRHHHSSDEAYNNVVLHLVYDHDQDILNQRGDVLPTLELRGRVKKTVINQFEDLRTNSQRIPCQDHFGTYPDLQFKAWLDRVLVERLARKTDDIDQLFHAAQSDWLQTFYALIAGFLGQNHNKSPFQELARLIPVKVLMKHVDQPRQMEAMLFGVARLLPLSHRDEYVSSLIDEFRFLKAKYKLSAVTQQWRFGGIRPNAFPTRRIALLAALVPHLHDIQQKILNGESVSLHKLRLETSPFWRSHYTFSQVSKARSGPSISESLSGLLEMNAVAPYLFYYGKQTGNQAILDQALQRLHSVLPERNGVTRKWGELGFQPENAAQSQALLELTAQYCNVKNCVLCNVGKSIISST